jgi:hypothetical protein
MRRRVTYNGNPLVQASVSAASYTVYQRTADGSWDAITAHADVELNVSDVISDEYQAWEVDSTGFNIEILLSSDLASPFDAWGSVYLVAVTLELVDGVVDGFGWLLRTPSL